MAVGNNRKPPYERRQLQVFGKRQLLRFWPGVVLVPFPHVPHSQTVNKSG